MFILHAQVLLVKTTNDVFLYMLALVTKIKDENFQNLQTGPIPHGF